MSEDSVVQKPSAEMVETALRTKHESIASIKTPKKHIQRRADGMDYVTEAFMRHQLNTHYPAWSWAIVDTEWLGSEWIVVRGELTIIDQGVPRKFGSIGASRVQFKKGCEHSPENIIDIDKNVATANTNALKRAINRLCDIANDVYKKTIEDFSITDEQADELKSLADSIKDDKITKAIHDGIEDQSINKDNYDASYKKLLKIKSIPKGDKDDK
tara:strand:- start:154 stop:795 length:642 start_codon:yes stop_codon:yes gene_type:complete